MNSLSVYYIASDMTIENNLIVIAVTIIGVGIACHHCHQYWCHLLSFWCHHCFVIVVAGVAIVVTTLRLMIALTVGHNSRVMHPECNI